MVTNNINCSIITLFPEMFSAITDYGVVGRAIKQNLLQLNYVSPRDYTTDIHQTVDDRPYGGGPGMVMKVEPLRDAVKTAKATAIANANVYGKANVNANANLSAQSKSACKTKVIYMSPQGKLVTQKKLVNFLESNINVHPIFVAGRYEGVDERFIEAYVDEQWSIGDYVLSGGELAVMVVLDAIARLIPGVLGNEESAIKDSFMSGLLDCPHYTRPQEIDGMAVPDVLLKGDHKNIERFRLKQQLGKTWLYRKDLLEQINLTSLEKELLKEFIADLNLDTKMGDRNHE